MAGTKKNRFRTQSVAAAKRRAEAAQRMANDLAAAAERAEEREAAREKGSEARLDAIDELYDRLGIEPEPKRKQVRIRGGEQQTMLVERDPRERARTAALLSLVEKLVGSVGEQGVAHYLAEVEHDRQRDRDEADAARSAKKRATAGAEPLQRLEAAPEQAPGDPRPGGPFMQ